MTEGDHLVIEFLLWSEQELRPEEAARMGGSVARQTILTAGVTIAKEIGLTVRPAEGDDTLVSQLPFGRDQGESPPAA